MRAKIYCFLTAFLLQLSCFAQIGISVKDTTVCKATTFNVCASTPANVISNINLDDEFSTVVNIGFPFTFYGQTYSQCVISDNNFISFNTNLAGQHSEFIYADARNAGELNNVIMFPFQDLYVPAGSPTIRYMTIGQAPNRRFIVEFCKVRYYDCTNLETTNQLILYEGSNVIEMHINRKDNCSTWPTTNATGKGVQGVRATTNASGVFVAGRGTTSATWTVSTPEAQRFTPTSATPAYTVSSIPYNAVPFISAGGTYNWYKGNSTTPYASTNCISITTDTATKYYVAKFTGLAGCGATGPTTLYDTVRINHLNPYIPKTLSYCSNQLPVTWNGMTIPAGTSNQNNYDTVYVTGANICDTNFVINLNITPALTPTFAAVASICSGAALAALPTTSTNGVTGTWSPAINNTTTTTYTFSPTSGQCANTTTMTIAVNPIVTPAFTAVAPICAGASLSTLPTTSNNQVTGTWSPALNNMATTTYTFTPTAGQCATSTTMTITVNPVITPTFTQVAPICSGATLAALPTTSNNGISGTWSPAINNTATTTYTFTPAAGACATTASMTITVNPNTTPVFTQVAPICSGAALAALPTTSNNGVTGTWSPAINNTATTTYTFTPTAGLCAPTATMTITVNPNTVPGFTQVPPICNGGSLAPLPTTSNNGVTGTWTPAINNTATTTYTFTPTAGQCATTATMTINVGNNTVPTFSQVAPVCSGATMTSLPTTSNNGISGTWSPALNNTATTTYTFTPTSGLCATTTTMTITVNPNTTPVFTQVAPICSGAALAALPTTSNNGVTGTWTPALNNTATTTYTFTPTAGQCTPTTTMTIMVNPNTTPTFTQVAPVCSGAALSPLPTTSNNGISGTWSPAVNNTATTTYTFTPTAGVCATTASMTITVNPVLTPAFTQVAPICSGATLNPLPTTSTNGVTGTWSPALNNTATTTYTFTPNAGQCATTATMSITVNPIVIPAFAQVASICSGANLAALPTTSNNGISGTWSPALNNTATTTYTFTPAAGACATNTTMTITVNPNSTPTFTQVPPICIGGTLSPLPTTSNNGITGTWTPALNNTATTTYTFTPTAGQCATTATMTITVGNNTVPTFNQVAPVCAGATIPALPTTSNNGIAGTWSPALNNTATTTYTFTPNATGSCVTTTTMTITVNPIVTPTFTPVGPICSGATLAALPASSTNGINGTWTPALNNTATTTYTFTPNAGQCATTASLTITVNPNTIPTFNPVTAVCAGTALSPLPITSNNGISGTWSPALNNTATTTYTFTPNAGVCATTATLTITINPNITPTFTQVPAVCIGSSLNALPTTSNNGISGTWSPALNNMATTTYTFTPNAGICATTTTMTININPYLTGVRNAAICQGSAYTFNGITYTTAVSGVKDTIANANSCDSIITLNLIVNPPTYGIQTVSICQGNSYTFNGIVYTSSNTTAKDTFVNAHGCDSIVTLNLSVIPVNPVTQSQNLSDCGRVVHNGITYTNSTTINDTVHTVLGCDSIYRIVHITVYPEYKIRNTIDTTACDRLIYKGVTYTQDATVMDTILSVSGCDSLVNTVHIHVAHFDLRAGIEPEMPYEGQEVRIQTYSTDGQAYEVISWTPAAYFANQNSSVQVFQATQAMNIVITAHNEQNCIDTASLSFKVRPYNKDIKIPNAFTPNGDGRNDVFVPVLGIDDGYNLTDFRVFNRWGQIVFSTTHLNTGWDGTYKGVLQEQDVYFYTVTVVFMDGTKKTFKGDVTLLR